MSVHGVRGGGGAALAVKVAGPPGAPPVVLLHGWAQSSVSWSAQLADPSLTSRYRLAAVDLRGHGMSDAPVEGYDDPQLWADDLAAVLDLVGKPALVVAWSYGGAVVTDYLRAYGDEDLAGIVYVGAVSEIGKNRPGARMGPALRAIIPYAWLEPLNPPMRAFTEFVRGMAEQHLPGALAQQIVGEGLRTPYYVRSRLFVRDTDSSDVLPGVTVPVLVSHGTLDAVIDPAVAEYIAGKIPGARLRWFDKVGHMPFIERTEEFAEMLLEFADEVFPHEGSPGGSPGDGSPGAGSPDGSPGAGSPGDGSPHEGER